MPVIEAIGHGTIFLITHAQVCAFGFLPSATELNFMEAAIGNNSHWY